MDSSLHLGVLAMSAVDACFKRSRFVLADRKPGESVKEVASRHFQVDPSYIWAAVAGFDEKQPTHEVKVHKSLHEDWYEMG